MRVLHSYITLFCIESLTVISSTNIVSFKSVNISYYVRGLYEQLGTEGEGYVCLLRCCIISFSCPKSPCTLSDAPSIDDPVFSDPTARDRICKDIVSNGIFLKMQLTACNLKDWYFHDIFSPYIHHSAQQYSRRQFRFMVPISSHPFYEYVFPCLVKYSRDSTIVPFYISKEYNVAPDAILSSWRKPGRFVLGNFVPTDEGHYFHEDFYVMLAEESAYLYVGHNFNIEMYYLNIRKYVQPGKLH